MFGFVTSEDRARWNQMKADSDQQLESARSGLTAKGLASQSAAPMIGMAERSINAQMTGEANAQRKAERDGRKERVELTETRTRFFEEDATPTSSDREMGY